MVRIICTGPAQEWPSDDSDFDEENLPGYRPPGKSKRKKYEEDDDDADSDYSISEDEPVKKKKNNSKKRMEKTKDKKDRKKKSTITRNPAAKITPLENFRYLF